MKYYIDSAGEFLSVSKGQAGMIPLSLVGDLLGLSRRTGYRRVAEEDGWIHYLYLGRAFISGRALAADLARSQQKEKVCKLKTLVKWCCQQSS